MKALVERVVQYGGKEYRLRAGQEAPEVPETLREIRIKNGYLEAPAEKPASRKPKEG